LPLARAFGRAIDKAVVLRAALTGGPRLSAAVGGVAVWRLSLMRGVLTVARLEVFELLARAFAVPCHGASGFAVRDRLR
jgi:hypothetical protein